MTTIRSDKKQVINNIYLISLHLHMYVYGKTTPVIVICSSDFSLSSKLVYLNKFVHIVMYLFTISVCTMAWWALPPPW